LNFSIDFSINLLTSNTQI